MGGILCCDVADCRATGCPLDWIGNGQCNDECNNDACSFDGGDCDIPEGENIPEDYCATGCPWNLIGNGQCNNECNNDACQLDWGDCDPVIGEDCPLDCGDGGYCNFIGDGWECLFYDGDDGEDSCSTHANCTGPVGYCFFNDEGTKSCDANCLNCFSDLDSVDSKCCPEANCAIDGNCEVGSDKYVVHDNYVARDNNFVYDPQFRRLSERALPKRNPKHKHKHKPKRNPKHKHKPKRKHKPKPKRKRKRNSKFKFNFKHKP